MIIDARIDLMTSCGVPVNGDPRIVPIWMISFVSMVNVSKGGDATNISSAPSMKMNICVIITVDLIDFLFLIVKRNEFRQEDDPRLFICPNIHLTLT
jgi:hypothetical protein